MTKPTPQGAPQSSKQSDPVHSIHMSDAQAATVYDWAARQSDMPSFSEAVCRLVEIGLTAEHSPTTLSPAGRAASDAYAKDAAKDSVRQVQAEASQSEATKASRRNRLTKVPPELSPNRRTKD